jgi:outer membrane lipopolysaccharide assembly protein LptE/RlpB
MKHMFCLAPVVVACLVLSGCGYALAGRGAHLPDYIKVIGVPPFQNKTAYPDLDRVLAEGVRAELSGRGKYQVKSDVTGADAVLTVIINSVSTTPVAFDINRNASRIAITVSVNVDFMDLKTNKSIWSNPAMQYSEQYDVTSGANVSDASAFFGQDATALQRLSQNFARQVVVAILETF